MDCTLELPYVTNKMSGDHNLSVYTPVRPSDAWEGLLAMSVEESALRARDFAAM